MSSSGPLIDCEVTNFIRGANPVWYFVDLVGKQFDDTFYLWVLNNQIPYNIATVYHDPSGTNPWAEPIQFLPNGTLPIDIYFANNTIYRLEIRQNNGILPPSQSDPLIYLIEDYNPSQAVDTPSNANGSSTTNLITNSQFSVVNFNQPVTYTNLTGSVEVAPGWFLDLNGAGSVTVSQVPLNNAIPTPTNAPYALQLLIQGPFANVPILRQRFQQNGVNWGGKTIASSLTAMVAAGQATLNVELYASNGTPLALLQQPSLGNAFAEFTGFATLPASSNPNTPPNAYIDLKIFLPASGDIYITSLQLVESGNAINVPYQQDTIDRQLDHLAHYYKPQFTYKPIPSYLTGWDFAKNPAQILGDTVAATGGYGPNKSFYAWDQTIVFQSVNNGVGVTRNANGGGLTLTAAQAGQFAILQYLEMAQVRDLLQGHMSVFVDAFGSNANGYKANVSLWVNNTDANLPNVATGTNNSAITALSALGKPTMGNGTWSEIPRSNFGDTQFTVTSTDSDFRFNGWNLNGATISNNANWFAIVIGFAPIAQNDTITINSVGLCRGDIATKPAPKTIDETIRDCERYYEMSYESFAAVGTATAVGALVAPMASSVPGAGGNVNVATNVPNCFGFEFRTKKRSLSYSPKIYSSVTGTLDRANIYMLYKGIAGNVDTTISTQFTINQGSKFINYIPTAIALANGTVGTTPGDSLTMATFNLTYQYIIDNRLGIN